jgi:quinol monooxygenase YgiN/uncharacterized protein YndB with AHSA1/START domain
MKRIHHVFDIDAPVSTVWAALTEAHGLVSWWSTRLSTSQAEVGAQQHWTFGGDFNPVMEIITLHENHELIWRCVAGHNPWKDSLFRFQLVGSDDGSTRLRFTQDYAIELDDDSYGTYNFNWGYYLESLRLFCTAGTGKPFRLDGASKAAETVVLATIKAKAGKEADLELVLRNVVAPTRAQPGCLQFELYRSAQDPAVMTAFEHWDSEENHERHLQGGHVKTLLSRFDEIVAAPPEFVFLKLL